MDRRNNRFNDPVRPPKRPRSPQSPDGHNRGRNDKNVRKRVQLEKPTHLFTAVPVAAWTCREEWMDVYSKISPVLANPEKWSRSAWDSCNHAIAVIEGCWRGAWNDRNPVLEVTVMVLRAIKAHHDDDHYFSGAANMAIVRFIKTVSEELLGGNATNTIRRTIVSVCERFGIPEWIVRIRHAAAHMELRDNHEIAEALFFISKWIKINYWDEERTRITDPRYMTKTPDEDSDAPEASEIAIAARSHLQGYAKRLANGQRGISKINARSVGWYFEFDIMTYVDIFAGVLCFEFLAPYGLDLSTIGSAEEAEALRSSRFPIIPKAMLDHWGPLVSYIMRHASGTHFMLFSLSRLAGCSDPGRDYLACAWMKFILDSTPKNVSSVRLWDTIDWMSMVRLITHRPSKNVVSILPMISQWVSTKDEYETLQSCIRLTRIIANPDVASGSSENLKTVADLEKEFPPVDENNDPSRKTESRWTLANDMNWTCVPIGLTPNQCVSDVDLFRLLLISSDKPNESRSSPTDNRPSGSGTNKSSSHSHR